MIIIETCPKCGHDLQDLVICTYPPIPKKECPSCGWHWEGEPEQIMRVPFGGNSLNVNSLDDYTLDCTITSRSVDIDIGDLNSYNLDDSLVSAFEQSACINCSNNPKNGGNGICHCTLGQMQIT